MEPFILKYRDSEHTIQEVICKNCTNIYLDSNSHACNIASLTPYLSSTGTLKACVTFFVANTAKESKQGLPEMQRKSKHLCTQRC